MSDSPDRPPPDRPRRPTLDESAEAIDTAISEMGDAVREIAVRTRSMGRAATPDSMQRRVRELNRVLRGVGGDLHRLSESAVPGRVRRAASEAERAVRESAERLADAADVMTPEQVQAVGREVERLLRGATVRLDQAAAEVRPQFVRSAARLDRALDYGQERLFRLLWFRVPPGSLLWNGHFQALLVSRTVTDVALQALLYGALISVARRGGGAFDAGLVGSAFLLPGVIFGLQGGAVADAVPKRIGLGLAYVGMGLLCLAVAFLVGSGFGALLAILFLVRTLHQVSQPSEASTVPLVATAEELASANAVLSLGSSIGEVAGKAVLAPVIVRQWGVEPVMIVAGALFFVSATRVLQLAPERERSGPPTGDQAIRGAVTFLLRERDVLWMLLLAALASTVGVVLAMLGPEYTRTVLEVDPSNALYVFMPAAFGLVAALALAPGLIARFGERRIAAAGFVLVSLAIAGMGEVDAVAAALRPVLPLDVGALSRSLQTAALLSIPLGAGTTLAAAAAQAYVGRSVPAALHGRTFALLGALKDGLAVAPLLGLGALAGVVGIRAVLVASPLVLILLAVGVSRASALAMRARPVEG